MSMRTHTCGELRAEHVGAEVALAGWVASLREHGGVSFLDLRDRYGRTQVVLGPGLSPDLGREYVVRVEGVVRRRPEGTANPRLATGAVEVEARGLEVLNASSAPPLEVGEGDEVSQDVRLRYRYVDLRRPAMQQNLLVRHRVVKAMRDGLDAQGFVEVETPFLTRSTPEGARDYLVPSRVHPGEFYALPQSPQIFKQLLMVAGLDRYFQVVRCFRDEDLRADRQPEFTQLDVEMSFVGEEDVFRVMEGVVEAIFRAAGRAVPALPLGRMSWKEAMDRYGSDKPDLRYGLEIEDLAALAARSEFRVFRSAAEAHGAVRGIRVPGGAAWTRKEVDAAESVAREAGAAGLAWMRLAAEGAAGPLARFYPLGARSELGLRLGAVEGDLVLAAADADWKRLSTALGAVRQWIARRSGLATGADRLVWVVDFPLFEWNAAERRWDPAHHPFTAFHPEDRPLVTADPGRVRSRSYDLVWNGVELGSGSVRLHRREDQALVFPVIGIDDEAARRKFGFLLDALGHGAPPHAGIALGVDRICMLLAGADSIREVVAFPKTARATCLMSEAPSPVDPRQLEELGIALRAPPRGAGTPH